MLDIRSLEKSFGAKRAVQGVSFTLEKGTVLGFLGPNGAGKSTTMRMIAGVLEPDAGDALIDGKSIVSHRRQAQAALACSTAERLRVAQRLLLAKARE